MKDLLRERFGESIARTIADRYRTVTGRLSVLRRLVRQELVRGIPLDVPLERRLWLWRRGFTSRSGVIFDVDADNHRQFLSTLQHERAESISMARRWAQVVNNKLTGYLLYGSFSEHLPDLYGILENGTLKRSSPLLATPSWEQTAPPTTAADTGRVEQTEAVAWIESYLDERSALVLKPVYGQGGEGVLVCRKEAGSDGYEVNGSEKTRAEFVALVEDLEEYLAWEFVEQSDYAERLFPDSTNTLRIMTFWDYETNEPFVGVAIQRIGTRRSAPVDNWSMRGLSAEVTEDGELGSSAQWLPSESTVRWFDAHPDTGRRIAGTPVPNWSAICERILDMAAAYPYLPRVGWDVLPTGDGQFKVLEVNGHAGTASVQVHRPLLRDPRIRRFYEHHGCL